jgi:two-component system, response regulator / RNA-binding antiterminator
LAPKPCRWERKARYRLLASHLLDGSRKGQALPNDLKVLLGECNPTRASILEERLGNISNGKILRVPAGSSLLEAVLALAPDVIIVAVEPASRAGLDDLRTVSVNNPRPIVMFADRDDSTFMEDAIAAGVTSYYVVDSAFPDINPIILAAIAIFQRQQRVVDDLAKAKASLQERENVNRAKSMLMRQRNIAEAQAYRLLQRRAMNESRRIGEIAAELLAADVDKPE